MTSKKELHLKINTLKTSMIQSSNENGINHPLTIQTSQKLDELINEYIKITQRNSL